MNTAPRPALAHLPRATTLSPAADLQARYSCGRGARHVIVFGHCSATQEEYFVVCPHEAELPLAAGYEPLWKR